MARRLTDVACFICSEAPCVCGKKKVAKLAPTKVEPLAKSPTETAPESRPIVRPSRASFRDAMRTAAATAPLVPHMPLAEPTPLPIERVKPTLSYGTDDELIEAHAIRLLNDNGMLDKVSREKFSMVLNGKPGLDELEQTRKALDRAIATTTQAN